MGYADFASRMDTFLSKNNINTLTSTLRVQKLSDYIQLKWTRILIIKPSELTINKKQKSNLMAFLRKIKYIRKKKTHNGHYCQQCQI